MLCYLLLVSADRGMLCAVQAMLTIKDKCCEIANGETALKLFRMTPGTVFRLEDFVTAQEEQAEVVVRSLKELHDATLKGVKEVRTRWLKEAAAVAVVAARGQGAGRGASRVRWGQGAVRCGQGAGRAGCRVSTVGG